MGTTSQLALCESPGCTSQRSMGALGLAQGAWMEAALTSCSRYANDTHCILDYGKGRRAG